ncbi:hypothetical protein AcW1_002054 [Taiwanofungus camphoratus]|nr:hypothetical protein AcV5_010051 [Antrodia cinnamomea]KAI0944311.1 hypothetical protein AcW1_002054 [Antrodia cinnamomea]
MSKKEKPLHSLIAGTTAGAVEAFVTYPTEFVKTRSQFSGKRESPLVIIRETLQTKGVSGLYSGCGALVVGNSIKAGVRFVSYDHFKYLLADSEGKVSAPRSLLAGLGAGMMEAILAVTPSETIKTKLIDDAKSSHPKYRGLLHGTVSIVREEGVGGVYRGLFPVVSVVFYPGPYDLVTRSLFLDDAPRSELCGSLHNIYNSQTIRTRHSASWAEFVHSHDVWYWCYRRVSHRIYDHALRCYQNTYAVARGATGVPQFLPLRVSDI